MPKKKDTVRMSVSALASHKYRYDVAYGNRTTTLCREGVHRAFDIDPKLEEFEIIMSKEKPEHRQYFEVFARMNHWGLYFYPKGGDIPIRAFDEIWWLVLDTVRCTRLAYYAARDIYTAKQLKDLCPLYIWVEYE